jgi:hypothetical protein
VDFEIAPEPADAEREAIVVALERLLSREPVPAAFRSDWRAEGLRENIEDEDQAGARPRSNPGATRA